MSGAACGRAKGRGGEEARMCACCGTEVGTKVCSGCHSVYYCGPACQKSHWSGGHKKQCADLGKAYVHEKNTAATKKMVEYRFAGAHKQLEKSKQVQREHAGREDSRSAELGAEVAGRTLVLEGTILAQEGRYKEGLEKLMEGLEISRKDNDHVEVYLALQGIAGTYVNQGKYDLGLQSYQEALEVGLKMHGPGHPVIGSLYGAMAATYRTVKDYDKALEYQEKSLKILRNAFGPEHPGVASVLNLIANVLRDQGKVELALRKHEDALQIQLKVQGAEHPDVACTYYNMGMVYHNLGQHDKALEYLNKALAIESKVLGNDHIRVAKTQYYLGIVYGDQGSLKRAKELFEACAKIYARVLGADHETTQNAIRLAISVGAGIA